MIYHSVLFKLKPETTPTQQSLIIEKLNSFEELDEVVFLKVGANFSDRGNGHQLLLTSAFESKEDFESYMKNEFHQATVNEFLKPHLDSVTVGDIDLPA